MHTVQEVCRKGVASLAILPNKNCSPPILWMLMPPIFRLYQYYYCVFHIIIPLSMSAWNETKVGLPTLGGRYLLHTHTFYFAMWLRKSHPNPGLYPCSLHMTLLWVILILSAWNNEYILISRYYEVWLFSLSYQKRTENIAFSVTER